VFERLARPRLKQLLVELLIPQQRQLVQDHEVLRHLVVREFRLRIQRELVDVCRGTSRQNHEGNANLLPERVWHRHDHRGAHRRM